MTIVEIRRVINSNIEDAILLLYDVYGEDPRFETLVSEYYSPTNNFQINSWRSRLVVYVIANRDKWIRHYDQGVENPICNYSILSELNFHQQITYFKALLYSNKRVIPFIVNGQREFGQKWLVNKLLKYLKEKYSSAHDDYMVNWRANDLDLFTFFKEVLMKFNPKVYDETDNIDRLVRKVKNGIQNRLETDYQFIIVENAHQYLSQKNGYLELIDKLKYINDEITDANINRKCILLFIDQEESLSIPEEVLLTPKNLEVNQMRTLFEQKDMAFIDLDDVTPISKNEFGTWLHQLEANVFKNFEPYSDNEYSQFHQLEQKCCGHPDMIIKHFCEVVLGEDYNKLLNTHCKW